MSVWRESRERAGLLRAGLLRASLRQATPRRVRPDLRWLRLRAVWALVVPFYFFARPTPRLLVAGATLAFAGLIVRAWAAASIDKERRLSTDGPYAFTRNPLYLGSLLMGLGVTVAGGRPLFVVLFAVFYLVAYGATMAAEARLLTARFGEQYHVYAAAVPAFLPRLTPYRPQAQASPPHIISERATARRASVTGESEVGSTPARVRTDALRRYLHNREWQALLGTVAGFAVLFVRWWWAS